MNRRKFNCMLAAVSVTGLMGCSSEYESVSHHLSSEEIINLLETQEFYGVGILSNLMAETTSLIPNNEINGLFELYPELLLISDSEHITKEVNRLISRDFLQGQIKMVQGFEFSILEIYIYKIKHSQSLS